MIRIVLLIFFVASSLLGADNDSHELEINSDFRNPLSGDVLYSDFTTNISVRKLNGDQFSNADSSINILYSKNDTSHYGTLEVTVDSNLTDSLLITLSVDQDSLDYKKIAVNGKRYLSGGKLPKVLGSDIWGGIRTKFWTTLIKPVDDSIEISYNDNSGIELVFQGTSSFDIYTGPVDRASLKKSEKYDLSALLYYELWPWVRLISIGLQKLLYLFVSFVKSYGLAIILLSIFVKIAMYPLVKIADKWQDEVNRTKSLLQPKIDEINKEYKGEEQHNRVMALYKENNVSPFYTIKSLAGFFIQIPVFFAAYHTLGEELSLKGFSFLWINDLSIQDHFVELPFSVPYFGSYLNLLPLLMTVITVLSAYIHTDESLSPQLLKKQRINLYSMAFLFFVLFYHFPAGMVLYWTMNNVSAFIKAVYLKFYKSKRA